MTQLLFEDYILDNIHGYIALTEMECKIEKLPVFRRLRGIKQLGLTNWIFPGAEHTRYSHSLGVMHIADQMASKLHFTAYERQLIRLAGMLHDIGHYPLSHVGERAYKKDAAVLQHSLKETVTAFAQTLSHQHDEERDILTHTLMEKSPNPFHHEAIGEQVIRNSRPILDIFHQYGFNVEDVCAIITGDIQNQRLVKFVQILHAELDADRIDYLLRDTFSSGTAYGAFEINTLIKNLDMAHHTEFGVDVIGVNSKGIMSADQFLINRYFAYSQVFYHKHVSIITYMAEKIIDWLLATSEGGFPDKDTLRTWITRQDETDDYFNFTDRFFMDAIKRLDVHTTHCPPLIATMIDMLNHYITPEILEPAERHNIILSGLNNSQLLEGMAQSGLLENKYPPEGFLKIDQTFLTRHVPIGLFRQIYAEHHKAFGLTAPLESYEKHRLIHGVGVIQNDGGICLLTDAHASLVKDLCRHRTVFFRTYHMNRS